MGVRTKLTAGITVLAAVAVAVTLAAGWHTDRALLRDQFRARGEMVAETFAESLLATAVELGSIHDEAPVARAAASDDIVAAYALDPDGRIVTDGTRRNALAGSVPETLGPLLREALASGRVAARPDGGLLAIVAPVQHDGTLHGAAHVVMRLGRADALADAALRRDGTVAAAGLGAVLLMGAAFSIRSRMPLRCILDAMRAVREGNYKVRLAIAGNDEHAQLAAIVNDVATTLRSATVSKRYLDEVLQSMVDSLIVVGTDANIVTVNRATIEMLGYEEKHLVGQPASLVCIDEGYQLTGARLHHLLGEQTQQDHELMYRTSSGSLIPISFSGSPIRDNTGEVVGYVCIGKDITERKRAEVERERLNKQLVDTSRQAGMAEVATGVLHNVGNVLNSVNMSASMVMDTIRRSKVAGLEKAVALMRSHDADLAAFLTGDEKGRQLPAYFDRVCGALADEQAQIIGELSSLSKNIDHIKEIISMQQSYSKVTGVLESVDLSELLDEALRLNASSLERHGVSVRRDVAYVPAVRTDKHKVLQVLVNLITNARDAMKDRPDGDERRMTVRLAADPDAPDQVRIAIEDTGCGIPAENLTRIFHHGFTTKKTGHGFGLHSAALTAKELGGSLHVESDGPGRGACFVLTVPMRVGKVAA